MKNLDLIVIYLIVFIIIGVLFWQASLGGKIGMILLGAYVANILVRQIQL